MRRVENYYHAPQSAWRRWTRKAKLLFNWLIATGTEDTTGWNTAFFAACEASGLDIEYEPKGGWR